MTRARLTKHGVFTPRTRARATDPQTSTDAAARVDVTEIQRRVLMIAASQMYRLGLTQPDAIAQYRRIYGEHTSESTIRTRVSELVDLGLMEAAAKNAEFFTVWRLTENGRTVCREMQA